MTKIKQKMNELKERATLVRQENEAIQKRYEREESQIERRQAYLERYQQMMYGSNIQNRIESINWDYMVREAPKNEAILWSLFSGRNRHSDSHYHVCYRNLSKDLALQSAKYILDATMRLDHLGEDAISIGRDLYDKIANETIAPSPIEGKSVAREISEDEWTNYKRAKLNPNPSNFDRLFARAYSMKEMKGERK